MNRRGTGRTKLGRTAALAIPGVVVTAGLSAAILQGLVAAQLSSANAFQVTGGRAVGSGLELSLRDATTATTNTDATETNKKSALVTLNDGRISDGLCLAANNSAPIVGNIGLTLNIADPVNLGDVDLSADSVVANGQTNLPETAIGIAERELDHQSSVAGGNAGAFGLESNEGLDTTDGQDAPAQGDVLITGLDADVYALQLGGLSLASGLTITPILGTASC